MQKASFDLRTKLIFARERNDLDRDFARQHRIVRRINDAIRAAADFIQDRESANRLRRRRHRQIERVERDGGCERFRHRRRIIALHALCDLANKSVMSCHRRVAARKRWAELACLGVGH